SLAGASFKRHASTATEPQFRNDALRLVSQRFQVLFPSPPGVLFTLPSRYSSAIGRQIVLSLRGGPRRFTPAFPDPALLGNTTRSLRAFRVRGSYPLWRDVPERFHYAADL